MSAKIPRLDTAFSLDNRSSQNGKKPAEKIPKHLTWIKSLRCVVTGKNNPDPAHVSYRDPRFAKPQRGYGEKSDDLWVVPLCRAEHDKQEFQMNEIEYWKRVGIDPVRVAAALYLHSGDDNAAAIILRHART